MRLKKLGGSLTPGQKGKRTRLENQRRALYQRMGGQGEPPLLRWGSLFVSDEKEADDGMIVVKSAADCDVAGKPMKKKLLWRKRRLRLGSKDKRTAPESD